jgi:integrase
MSQQRTSHLRRYIFPAFGDREMSTITQGEVDQWIVSLPLAGQTVNHILHTFRLVMREAKAMGHIKDDPVREVSPVKNNSRPPDVLTLEELQVLFPRSAAELVRVWGHAKYATAFYLILTTGMRVSEVCALRWKHVVWSERGILVVEAWKSDGQLGPPKSGKGRSVLAPRRTMAMLKWWQAQTPMPEPEHLVFPGEGPDGRTSRETMTRRVGLALSRAGVTLAGRRITAHALRHMYNTRMRYLLPSDALHYMIGHSSDEMTARYDRSTPTDRLRELRSVQALIDSAWK